MKLEIWHLYLIDDDFGNRVGDGIGIKAADVAHLSPLPKRSSPRRTSAGWPTSATTRPASPAAASSPARSTSCDWARRRERREARERWRPTTARPATVPGDGLGAKTDLRETAPPS